MVFDKTAFNACSELEIEQEVEELRLFTKAVDTETDVFNSHQMLALLLYGSR